MQDAEIGVLSAGVMSADASALGGRRPDHWQALFSARQQERRGARSAAPSPAWATWAAAQEQPASA
jgi:hypothetical protein